MLIGSRKLSHSDRGAGFGHINSSESHQSTAARYETDLLSVQPSPITQKLTNVFRGSPNPHNGIKSLLSVVFQCISVMVLFSVCCFLFYFGIFMLMCHVLLSTSCFYLFSRPFPAHLCRSLVFSPHSLVSCVPVAAPPSSCVLHVNVLSSMASALSSALCFSVFLSLDFPCCVLHLGPILSNPQCLKLTH